MINTILSAITSAFSKDFLFASALPAVIALVWVVGVLIGVFGIEYSFGFFDVLTVSQKASITTLVTLGLIVTAYLLSALRSSLIRAWSGESKLVQAFLIGFIVLRESSHRRRYQQLDALKEKSSHWHAVKAKFQRAATHTWFEETKGPYFLVLGWIRLRAATGLYDGMSRKQALRLLLGIAKSYRHIPPSSLEAVHSKILKRLDELHEIISYRVRDAHVELDREFGSVANIRATRLGNVIQAYNHYGYKRYQLETELFWPRLLRVIPADYASQVKEPKIILDFAVTMATVSLALAFGASILGPWLWHDAILLGGIISFHFVAAAFFYLLSVKAAVQYGDMIRSCVDLFRLSLMEALQYTRPKGTNEERSRWEKISQLLTYGQAYNDLKIPPSSGSDSG